jgi:NAD(P)H-dependent FMN reductase
MSDTMQGIRIVTLLGTPRPGNYTGKALNLVHDELRQQGAVVETFDPAGMSLDFPGQGMTEDAKRMQESVRGASGLVLATPEYHGCFSSMLKLMIENLGFPSAMAGRPVALLGVASGQIGAIKSLEQLRGVCSHVGSIVLPGPVSVAGVNRVFDEEGHCLDEATEKRVRGVATNLLDYLKQNVCPRMALEAFVREQSTS